MRLINLTKSKQSTVFNFQHETQGVPSHFFISPSSCELRTHFFSFQACIKIKDRIILHIESNRKNPKFKAVIVLCSLIKSTTDVIIDIGESMFIKHLQVIEIQILLKQASNNF